MGNLDFDGNFRGPKDLGTMTLGTAWQTVGSAKVGGARWLGAYLGWTINDSVDLRYRLRAHLEAGGSAYLLPIRTVSANDVKVEDNYYEENVDASKRRFITFDLDACVPWVSLQASVGTAGGTAATLDGCNVFTGLR